MWWDGHYDPERCVEWDDQEIPDRIWLKIYHWWAEAKSAKFHKNPGIHGNEFKEVKRIMIALLIDVAEHSVLTIVLVIHFAGIYPVL